MSRLNNQNSLNYGNKETHIFTEFGTLAKENTQKEVLEAIKNININIEGGTFEANDVVTHEKLDTLNTTITNKTEEKPKVFVSEICQMQNELIKAFLDLSYKSTELINKFKVHIQLYGKWINEVEGRLSSKEQIDEAKNALKAQEKKYLDSYLIDAITIYEILIKLKAEIEKYRRAECDQPFIPTNITTSNTTTTTITTTTVISSNVTNSPTTITTQKPVEPTKGKTLDTSEITKATNTLIQLITERYDSLGITMDRKLAIMLKTTMGAKSRKFLRCH
jgi:PIN domain nuclease of toxin-antitoxin system